MYLITANSDKNPVKVTLSKQEKFNSASVLNEVRTLSFENGEITDYYEPFDVPVYLLN